MQIIEDYKYTHILNFLGLYSLQNSIPLKSEENSEIDGTHKHCFEWYDLFKGLLAVVFNQSYKYS